MKYNINSHNGVGQFNRLLRKMNNATDNMRISHSGTYAMRYCNLKRWKKWESVHKKLTTKRIK